MLSEIKQFLHFIMLQTLKNISEKLNYHQNDTPVNWRILNET